MDDQQGTPAPPPDAATDEPRLGGGVLPGIAIAALILGGIGVFLYADWRREHPAPEVPEGIEPMLKAPGEVPNEWRKPPAVPSTSQQ